MHFEIERIVDRVNEIRSFMTDIVVAKGSRGTPL